MATQTVSPQTIPLPKLTQEQAWDNWLAQRNTFIGGSEVYELFNIPQYGKGCARSLGYRKLGIEPDYPERMNKKLLRRGQMLEPIVAALYEEETGRKVRRPSMDEFGLPKVQRHPQFPFLGVHTDRFILAGAGGVTETGDLEIKTHQEGPFLNIVRNGIFPSHSLQVQHSMLVTGHKWGSFAVLWPDAFELKPFDIERDDKVIDEITRRGAEFASLIERQELPPQLPDADDQRCKVCQFRVTCREETIDKDEVAFVKKQRASKVQLVQIQNAELVQNIAAMQAIQQEIEALTNDSDDAPGALELIKGKISSQLEAMGISEDSAAVTPELGVKLTLKETFYNGLDQKALKEKMPEVYEQFKVSRPTGNKSLRLWPFTM